jgi:anti-sigma factor RsiW
VFHGRDDESLEIMSRDRRHDDILLTRHLAGELSPAETAAVEGRLAAEPALAARRKRLAAVWDGVELPPAADPPPGFASRIARRAVTGTERAATPGAFWGWARTAGAAALVSGLLLGGGVGVWAEPWLQTFLPAATVATVDADDSYLPDLPDSAWESAALPSLADTYWSDLESATPAAAGATTTSEDLR